MATTAAYSRERTALLIVGLLANTYIESTARFSTAAEMIAALPKT